MRESLLFSFLIGFFTASPLGPIGLLCMRRVFFQGFTSGIISSLGISFAYAFWAYVAVHGLATFSYWIERERQPLEIAVGLFFVLYGLHAIFNSPSTKYPNLNSGGRLAQFFSTFLVVFLNPASFALFTVLFTLFGIAKRHFGLFDSIEIALSVFLGAITFWIAVSFIIHKIKSKIEDTVFKKISRISAFGMLVFGLAILAYAIMNI